MQRKTLLSHCSNRASRIMLLCRRPVPSPNYIKKLASKVQKTEAFKLFANRYSPEKVKIELGISTENAEKYYLAYMKSVSLVDLFPIYNDLGDCLPDFVRFYKSAKSYNINPL